MRNFAAGPHENTVLVNGFPGSRRRGPRSDRVIFFIRMVSVVAVAALVAASAANAAGGRGGKRRPDAEKSQVTQKLTRERENAYQNALKNIPNGKANPDPWAGAR